MNKKPLLILLAFAVITACFSACSQPVTPPSEPLTSAETETEIVEDTTSFKLSYSKSDSLNPFQSETLNNQVLEDLVFESLFVLDESYEAQPAIATGYSYPDSKTLIVTFPSGLQFSNGDKIDADTVVYSFNKAKDSPHWGAALAPISSASAESATSVRFRLSYANPNAHNLLTFAIADTETDENGYSIGSGRYKFGAGEGNVYLEKNDQYENFNPRFTRINLVNITSAESIDNAINIGNISYAFRDMSTGMKSKMQCNKKAVNMNNLVYIGVNCKSGITADENIRKAISLAVDRDVLLKSAYRGYAKVATSVFHPASSLGKQTAVFSASADINAAKKAIEQSGVTVSDLKIDILTSDSESKSAAAQLIKQQLEAVGFTVTINEENSDNYLSKVNSSSFNIYIGETKIPDDMNLSSFFSKSGATSSGIDLDNFNVYNSYWGYLDGSNELGKFIIDFSTELPFIPLLYRQGMICTSKSMHGDMQGYEENYFSNIEDWYFN